MTSHLPEAPKELRDIAEIRKRLLAGNADEDQISEVGEWEARAKEALIFLNLKKHEGIGMILRRAFEELRDIDEVLRKQEVTDLSVEGAMKFASETAVLQERKKLWRWFIELFSVAESDLDAIRMEVERQLGDEDESAKNLEEEVAEE